MALKNGSSGTIGWTDIMGMVAALEGLHTCRVGIRISTLGRGHVGGGLIVVDAAFNVLPGSDLPPTVSVSAEWPSTKARSEWGLIYNLLWQLDYAISQAYEQMPLKEP